jgi:hypothetical protein
MAFECVANDLGKFLCTFGGVSLNCTVDSDCPGDALCYKDAQWSATSTQCACSMTFAKSGGDCRATGSNIGFLLFLVVLNMTIYIVALALNLWSAYRLADKRRTSMYFTIFCCTLSCAFGTAVFAVYIAQLTAGLPSQIHGENEKLVALVQQSNHLIAMLFLFTCVGVLNVSVTWVYVAEKAKSNHTKLADRYRIGMNLFFIVFVIALIVLQIDPSHQPYVQYVCIPSILYFSVGFMVGYARLRHHIERSLALARYGGSPANRERMVMIYRTISTTTFMCSIHSCILILFVIIGAILGIDGDTPVYPTVSVIYQVAYLFAALLILQVSWYTFSFASNRKRHSPTTEESDQQVVPATFSSNDPRSVQKTENTAPTAGENAAVFVAISAPLIADNGNTGWTPELETIESSKDQDER